MELVFQMIADTLLGAGAIGAGIYCMVLSRRLKRFNTLENGVGGAVAVLSAQVDDMTKTLKHAREAAGESSATLTRLTERAEGAAQKLELMLASLHDLPAAGSDPASAEAEQDASWESAQQQNAAGDDPDTPLFLSHRARVSA